MGKHSHKEKQKKLKNDKKKHKKREKKRHSSTSSSSDASSADEWVEKDAPKQQEEKPAKQLLQRPQDDWDLFSTAIPTSSRPDRKTERDEAKRKEREANQYDPSKCSRELNPYWKDGGDGLPSANFKKPAEAEDNRRESDYRRSSSYSSSRSSGSGSNWRKKNTSAGERYEDARDRRSDSRTSPSRRSNSDSNWRKTRERHEDDRSSASGPSWKKKTNSSREEQYEDNSKNRETEKEQVPSSSCSMSASTKCDEEPEEILTDKQLNELAAKVVKAEILGNADLANRLKEKLERARNAKKVGVKVASDDEEEDGVLLTKTDSKGFSRPLASSSYSESDKYGGRKSKKQKVETHEAGDRIRYFADDDKYSLQEMFENEKFSTSAQQDRELAKISEKIAKNDDMDDSFTDKIRSKRSTRDDDEKAKSKAIAEHRKTEKSLDSCLRCLQSSRMPKHLMIALGQNAYLTLPAHEPLTDGHCVIVPNRHVPCGTQLDENEWEEMQDLRKSLTRMFAARGEDVIFFEVAVGLHRFPHMSLECVPVPKEEGDMAPIYFKKAIDECEMEWATNKKLVSLKGRDVRRAVPKGLSYFCVSFGMDDAGYAHVIEDLALFPTNFAQEIIGGMLDLDHGKWRKPRLEKFDVQKARVLEFSKQWADYDCTSNKL